MYEVQKHSLELLPKATFIFHTFKDTIDKGHTYFYFQFMNPRTTVLQNYSKHY